MKIINHAKNAPEIAICWYLDQMFGTEQFLVSFLENYLKQNIDIKEVEIVREKSYGNKRIDLCFYITDMEGKDYGVVIEAKVHWPDEEQLLNSVERFKEEHPDFEKVFGLHFISTIDKKQIDALSDHKWKFEIVKIADFLKLFCLNGINTGHSLRWASDLHQLLNYERSPK